MKKTVKKSQRQTTKRSTLKPRGISKIVLLAVVAIVLVGAGGAFFLFQKGGSGTSSALPFVKPALNPNCKYNDPELCKFINNFPTQTNYSVTSTGSFDGMKSESLIEISGEDKYHMVSKLNGEENLNMISIGNTTYTLDYSDKKWWKQTVKQDDTTQSSTKEIIDKNTFQEEMEDKTSYKFVVKEACGDLMCFKYEMVSPDMAETKSYIWFDDRDYLMRKMRYEDKSGMFSEAAYSYNPVSITEPSPVKEGEPNSFQGMPQMDDPEVQKMMQQYKEESSKAQSQFDSSSQGEYNAPEEY